MFTPNSKSELKENPQAMHPAENLFDALNIVAKTLDGNIKSRVEGKNGQYKHPGFDHKEPGEADEIVIRFYQIRSSRKDREIARISSDAKRAKGWLLERANQVAKVESGAYLDSVDKALRRADKMKNMGKMEIANAFWALALDRAIDQAIEQGRDRLKISIREEPLNNWGLSDGHHDLAWIQGRGETPDVCIPVPLLCRKTAYWFAAHADRREPVEHDRETIDSIEDAHPIPVVPDEAERAEERYLDSSKEWVVSEGPEFCRRFRRTEMGRFRIEDPELQEYWDEVLLPAIENVAPEVKPIQRNAIFRKAALNSAGYPDMATHCLRAEAATVLEVRYQKITKQVRVENGLYPKW